MPDRERGRDTGVAETDSDVMTRDPATGHTARDPAMGDTARDAHPRRRVRRRAIRHATSPTARDPATDDTARDDHFFTRQCVVRLSGGAAVRWCGGPVVRRPGGVMMFSYARLCPVMPGYARLCPIMSDYTH